MSSPMDYPFPSSDGTHHVDADGKPAYAKRFQQVGKFHPPGLAPVLDDSGWFHINREGEPAYPTRYKHVWGFYCGRAAAKDVRGWMHINESGARTYGERFIWAGNFQENRCTVQAESGFFHIDTEGRPIYAEAHAYAGDFRDGIAVVTSLHDGLCRHITSDGSLLHEQAFVDLDVFHKGFARARDSRGWHHVDRLGQACYFERYASIEPFYNGLARADTFDGRRVRIDATGAEVDSFKDGWMTTDETFQSLSADIVGYWKSFTITCAVKTGLFEALPGTANDVASRIEMSGEMALRLLRATAELGLATRDPQGIWSRTRRGEFLALGHPTTLAFSALEMGGPYVERWRQLESTLKRRALPGDVFAEAALSPDRASSLQAMMNSYAIRDYGEAISALALPETGIIVDAGGGLGALARGMKRARPGLEVLVLERPEVCQLAKAIATDGAVRWVAWDFTQPWPVVADVVTMSRVLHDWDDAKCLVILSHARACLKSGGKVIIVESVLSENGWGGGMCDLHLLAVSGGKERTLAEFISLCDAAGLELSGMSKASGLHQALHFNPSS